MKDLTEAASRLLGELGKKRKSKGEPAIEGLAEYRNTVGLAGMVRGIGFFVQAVHNRELYHCVAEDDAGRLYFLLPHGVSHFELRGREIPHSKLAFPGKYQVDVGKRKPPSKSSKRKKSKDTKDEAPQSKARAPEKEDDSSDMDGESMSDDSEMPAQDKSKKPGKKKPPSDE